MRKFADAISGLRKRWTGCSIATLIVAPLLILHATEGFGEPSPFFQGKQIRFIVGSPVGGGVDLYGRFFAAHLSAYLPGHPSVVVENMPGAAGLVSANYLTNEAPRDGTVIATFPGTVLTAPLFKSPGVRFDANALSWFGSMTSDVAVSLSWASSPVKTARDLLTNELVVGGVQATDATVVYPNVLNSVLKTKFKVVAGYHGTSEVALALERGEIQGVGSWNYSSLAANKEDWLRDKKVNLLLQIALEPRPDLGDVPSVMDLASNDSERSLLKLIFAPLKVARPIAGPPNMSGRASAVLQSAFDTMLADPAFRADAAAKNIDLESPMSAGEVRAFISALYASDSQLLTQASTLLSQQ